MPRLPAALALLTLFLACRESHQPERARAEPVRPSILLVTLDTTRFDAIGSETPAINSLIARGRFFRRAYATAPHTLPSHTSMLTGLYPAGHGVHENARYLGANHPLAAERLKAAGYRTAAFVSAYPLLRPFGLARGFETYDDELGEGAGRERTAAATTDRALAWLAKQNAEPLFLWVHYFEPHFPYEPPEEYRGAPTAYLGEVAAMDAQLARLVREFETRAGRPVAIVVVGDHGEGLGDHGEAQHGKLLYESVMHVPLVLAGPGIAGGTTDETPVSTRRVFHTLLDLAGLSTELSLRNGAAEVVAGEAMAPFLEHGWQPQVMAVEGRLKVIQAGGIEIYDVVADPGERSDLAGSAELSRELRRTLREYPLPSLDAPSGKANLTEEERRQLVSLGYITADVRPAVRKDAPRPRDMTGLFEPLAIASGLFQKEKYREAIPVLQEILRRDPNNLLSVIQLATAQSVAGQFEQAEASFRRAEAIAPQSIDVRHYRGLYHLRRGDIERAAPLVESVVSAEPDRLPALEALARIRQHQRRSEDALALWSRVGPIRELTAAEQVQVGRLAMDLGRTPEALAAFERARELQGPAFRNHLELGVLYMAARRYGEAAVALDAVPPSDPGWPMALFKRAQVSVLRNEPDAGARIARARGNADTTTRPLIARETLFKGR